MTLAISKHFSEARKQFEVMVDDTLTPGIYYLIDYYSWIDAVPEGASKEQAQEIINELIRERSLSIGFNIADQVQSRFEQAYIFTIM